MAAHAVERISTGIYLVAQRQKRLQGFVVVKLRCRCTNVPSVHGALVKRVDLARFPLTASQASLLGIAVTWIHSRSVRKACCNSSRQIRRRI